MAAGEFPPIADLGGTDMTNSLRRSSWLDDLLAQTNVADVLCEALARTLKGADATAISNAIGAVAARLAMLEKQTEEWAFWRHILEMMLVGDRVPPAAKTAARRALRGGYSLNAMTFLAECIVEHMRPKEVDCSHLTDEGVSTPGDTVVCMRRAT
jgi:hypothetical protein